MENPSNIDNFEGACFFLTCNFQEFSNQCKTLILVLHQGLKIIFIPNGLASLWAALFVFNILNFKVLSCLESPKY